MRDEIERILEIYEGFSREALVNALVRFVEHERFDAKHEAMMETMDKVRASFGVSRSEENS